MISNNILSTQARKRLQAGELILDGFDNDEIAEIVKCRPCNHTNVIKKRLTVGQMKL